MLYFLSYLVYHYITNKLEEFTYMEFLELTKKRYSCRKFLEKPVEEEKIQILLESAKFAPTAVNFQPQRILVLTDKSKIESLDKNKCTRYTFNAPLIMVVCYDTEKSWKRKYDNSDEGIIDSAIVTTHMMLQATDLGLGSTWVGSFDPKLTKKTLNIPDKYEVVALLPIGYPAQEPSESHFKRIEPEEFSSRNEFV